MDIKKGRKKDKCSSIKSENVNSNPEKYVRFEILMAVPMKSTIFWDVTPCSLVKCTDISEECSS
jgi:hypothetical protein